MKTRPSQICIRRLMVTSSQESKRIEIMNGNSIQITTFSDMEKKELKTELPWHFTPRDMKTNSQKQPSSRRQSRIIELSLKTSLENQRTWDKVNQIEVPILFTASKTFKEKTHGTLLDAFMVNQTREKSSQTTT